MTTPRNPSAASLPAAVWQVVRSDAIAGLTVAAFALLAVLHLTPWLTPAQKATLGSADAPDLPFFALILLACWSGLGRIERREERRFWITLSVAFASWMLASLTTAFFADAFSQLSQVGYQLFLETLYALYYAFFVLAVARVPHLPVRPRTTSLVLSWLAVAVLILGLFAYFVLIPLLLNLRAYQEVLPSTYLFLLLDAFLAARLAVLARGAESRRWRRVYGVLALTSAMVFINDIQHSELPGSGLGGSWGVPGALLWSGQWLAFVLAARLRHVPADGDERGPEARPFEKSRALPRLAELREQTLAFTVTFPVLHFALYALGALDDAIRPAREASMLAWLLLMATVAVIQHRLLEASRRNLERDSKALSHDLSEREEHAARRQELIAALESRQQAIEAKSAELERFTYTVSHDLRSPLVTIQGFLGVVEREVAAGDLGQIEGPIDRVDAAAGKMWRFLEELLELQRVGRAAGEPAEVAMGELVGEVVESLSGVIEERGVAIEAAPDLPTVRGDRTRLLEVWQNLVENAVRYMGDQRGPKIEIGHRSDDGRAVFFVRDNGIGIDLLDQAKVFVLFHRLDPGVTDGTGIGLALAKRIVEQHGGDIWVESEGVGRGSTFYWSLPMGAAAWRP